MSAIFLNGKYLPFSEYLVYGTLLPLVLSCVIHGGVFFSICLKKILIIAGTYESSFVREKVRDLGACNSDKELDVRYCTLCRWLELLSIGCVKVLTKVVLPPVESFPIAVASDSCVCKGNEGSSDLKGTSSKILFWEFDVPSCFPHVCRIGLTLMILSFA
jgi:hypothetical protein